MAIRVPDRTSAGVAQRRLRSPPGQGSPSRRRSSSVCRSSSVSVRGSSSTTHSGADPADRPRRAPSCSAESRGPTLGGDQPVGEGVCGSTDAESRRPSSPCVTVMVLVLGSHREHRVPGLQHACRRRRPIRSEAAPRRARPGACRPLSAPNRSRSAAHLRGRRDPLPRLAARSSRRSSTRRSSESSSGHLGIGQQPGRAQRALADRRETAAAR